MNKIELKKKQRTVVTGKMGEERTKQVKTYGSIIYRGTVTLDDLAEHIMQHGTVFTEDVVVGLITRLKNCMVELLSDGWKVKLDGIGTLYPKVTSAGTASADDYTPESNVRRLGVAFVADQSKRSKYKASAMRERVSLSTELFQELTSDTGDDGGTDEP